jgi:capsular polysaccharide export protein
VRVLLLQGPVGGFFSYLARDLSNRGHTVAKFNFNGGDLIFSLYSRSINYHGGQKAWRTWLRNFCTNWRPDVILLFGDQRPIHRIAIRVAKELGIDVYAFEEGYIRPNYVTFERGGNNARSPLLRKGLRFKDIEDLPEPTEPRPQFGVMAWRAIVYYIAKALGTFLYPGYLHHRRRTLIGEAYLWTRSWVRLLRKKGPDRRLVEQLRSETAPPFFLVALQVHDDLQLLRHGCGWRNNRLAHAIITSFAAHAPAGHLLIFKVHPMDRGHRHYETRIGDLAAKLGIADRVRVLQSGPLAPVVRAARGLVTINSSSGIAAIAAGIPVLAFGKAIYGIPGLAKGEATLDDLDDFWKNPVTPTEKLAQRVVALLKRDHMLPGSFYLGETWRRMSEAVDARLRLDFSIEASSGAELPVASGLQRK